jgi:protein O-GlcNAc transferase
MQFIWFALIFLIGFATPALSQTEATVSADGNAAYYFLLGRRLESQGKIDDAIAAHKKAMQLEPDSAELRAELAGLYARQDRAADSLQMAEAALKLDPANREANRITGSVYAAFADAKQPLRPGDNPAQYASKAIAALETARRPNTFDVGLELTLGRLYVQTGAAEKAIPLLQRVVADQPGYPDAAFLLANAQEGAGRTRDAIATLENLVEGNPTFSRGYLRLAELYERERQWAAAAAAYERAQQLNPRATALTVRRAGALINAGKASQARDILDRALSVAKPGAEDS